MARWLRVGFALLVSAVLLAPATMAAPAKTMSKTPARKMGHTGHRTTKTRHTGHRAVMPGHKGHRTAKHRAHRAKRMAQRDNRSSMAKRVTR